MMFIFLLLTTITSFANTNFSLKDVSVDCPPSIVCSQRKTRFNNLIGEYRSLVHLKDTLRVMASDGGYQFFFYELHQEKETYRLSIRFKLKPLIQEINIGFSDRNLEYDPNQLVTLKEGDYYEAHLVKETLDGLKRKLENLGYPNNTHTFEVIERNEKVDVNVVITLGEPRIFKTLKSNSKSIFIRDYLKAKFNNLYNKPFDLNKFKLSLDEAQKELFTYGYYLLSLDFVPKIKGNRVNLDVKVTNEQLYAFDFKNLERQKRDVLHSLVVDLFRKYKRPLSEQALETTIKEFYMSKAFLNTKVEIETSEFKNMYQENVFLYRIFLNESFKTRLVDVSFQGNKYYSKEKLKTMFDKEAFELASINYFDEEYFKYFQDYLKSRYIENGFVQIKIQDPVDVMDPDKKIASIEYNIQEGIRAYVKKIDFIGLPLELEDQVLEVIDNKLGRPFNPISMVEDIKKVTTILQENGYYYAEVLNSNENDLIQYNKTGSDVYIKFRIDPGSIVRLSRVLYLGNDKTKKKVLLKKIPLKYNDLITPSKTRDIEAAISATGLFNSVNVYPIRHNSKNETTDLVVKVVEREYGLVEIAPGFRTDLGIKLTGTATYQNLGGYNRSVTLKSILNQRLSFKTLDPVRRQQEKRFLEHNTSLSFTQGDVFDSLIDVGASAAYQTKRFYSFDANIFRVNTTLTRDISKNFSTSIRYQFEDIKQYDATQAIDNGSFVIGAITPSITYDLRNSQINPLKGAFFNLSTEFANPYLLSQKEPDLTINYYKLVSRNRFYIPFKNGTLAISAVGGMQENLANDDISIDGVQQTSGYIPNIKVFRLTGTDIIRGFNDEEMNKLPDNRDISQVRVDNKAYMAVFKIEPRYFINDSFMAGLFYDAGRVFVDEFSLGELRDSVGITFKVVTPVGTLDFDYGRKLLRKRNADGSLEDPGRFHVSIGFF